MFQFQNPENLRLLAALPLIGAMLYAYIRWRRAAMSRLGDAERLLPPFSEKKFWWKGVLLLLAVACLSVAWANPQLGAKKQVTTQESSDVFLAMDISQSMLCQDLVPSRLEMAKIFAQKVVKSLAGERVGLIFFAGNAFMAVPLSDDYSFVLESIQQASPDLLTEQGTAIASALELAEKSFEPNSGGGRAIILITDGENHDDTATEAAKSALSAGTMVVAVGAGTVTGGPIPETSWEGGSFKRDENGTVILTKLNEDMLQKIAQAGGGMALNVRQSDRAVAAISREVSQLEKRSFDRRSTTELDSWYQWFLLPVLLLLGLERGISFWKKNKTTA